MNTLIYSILGGMIATLLSAVGGYYTGYQNGQDVGQKTATVEAQSATIEQQSKALQIYIDGAEKHKALIEESNTASLRLRKASATRNKSHRKQIQELKNELAQTQSARSNCIVPVSSVQRIEAARKQAIRAASGSTK